MKSGPSIGSCHEPALLLPAPRQAVWTGGTCPADAPRQVSVDAALPTEGYRLDIGAAGIHIVHADATGLRHAQATLAQLAAHGPLPCGTIEDSPRFAVRGLMLDCSRDRIPTNAELRRLLSQVVQESSRAQAVALMAVGGSAVALLPESVAAGQAGFRSIPLLDGAGEEVFLDLVIGSAAQPSPAARAFLACAGPEGLVGF